MEKCSCSEKWAKEIARLKKVLTTIVLATSKDTAASKKQLSQNDSNCIWAISCSIDIAL